MGLLSRSSNNSSDGSSVLATTVTPDRRPFRLLRNKWIAFKKRINHPLDDAVGLAFVMAAAGILGYWVGFIPASIVNAIPAAPSWVTILSQFMPIILMILSLLAVCMVVVQTPHGWPSPRSSVRDYGYPLDEHGDRVDAIVIDPSAVRLPKIMGSDDRRLVESILGHLIGNGTPIIWSNEREAEDDKSCLYDDAANILIEKISGRGENDEEHILTVPSRIEGQYRIRAGSTACHMDNNSIGKLARVLDSALIRSARGTGCMHDLGKDTAIYNYIRSLTSKNTGRKSSCKEELEDCRMLLDAVSRMSSNLGLRKDEVNAARITLDALNDVGENHDRSGRVVLSTSVNDLHGTLLRLLESFTSIQDDVESVRDANHILVEFNQKLRSAAVSPE